MEKCNQSVKVWYSEEYWAGFLAPELGNKPEKGRKIALLSGHVAQTSLYEHDSIDK